MLYKGNKRYLTFSEVDVTTLGWVTEERISLRYGLRNLDV
jgi:hypothetical protein